MSEINSYSMSKTLIILFITFSFIFEHVSFKFWTLYAVHNVTSHSFVNFTQ